MSVFFFELSVLSDSDYSLSETLLRIAIGSHKECTYQLACLGINPFPIKEDGTVDMTHHWDWVRRCQETEGPRKRQKRSADMRDTLGV